MFLANPKENKVQLKISTGDSRVKKITDSHHLNTSVLLVHPASYPHFSIESTMYRIEITISKFAALKHSTTQIACSDSIRETMFALVKNTLVIIIPEEAYTRLGIQGRKQSDGNWRLELQTPLVKSYLVKLEIFADEFTVITHLPIDNNSEEIKSVVTQKECHVLVPVINETNTLELLEWTGLVMIDSPLIHPQPQHDSTPALDPYVCQLELPESTVQRVRITLITGLVPAFLVTNWTQILKTHIDSQSDLNEEKWAVVVGKGPRQAAVSWGLGYTGYLTNAENDYMVVIRAGKDDMCCSVHGHFSN